MEPADVFEGIYKSVKVLRLVGREHLIDCFR